MLSVNAQAVTIVRRILDAPEVFGVEVSRLANGSVLVDLGQTAPGSWQAGRLFTQIAVGGLGEVSFESFQHGGRRLPAIRLMVDRPLVACMGCQVAGWRLADEPDAPILAGPARTLKDPPDHHVRLAGYRDAWHEGVITVQMSRPVTAEMAQIVADACGLKPEGLYILATRHACLVSSIQVPARGIETAMHRLALDGFDLGCIRHAACTGPIPPLIEDELTAFGRINDALYYGSEVTLYADTDDAILARLVPQAVSAVSPLARRTFAQLYREANYDFHRIPLRAHTPAVLHVTNLKSGRTFSAGCVDEEVLARSFYP
jgi:methenyltetrahydromethanopterin cyclohydrolase